MTVTIPVWIDCDPGHDDTIALLLASFHPCYNLVGVSTTYGNASLENTTNNALAMMTAFGRTDVPVYVGSSKPLEKEPHYAPGIHGSNGLGGIRIPQPAGATVNSVGDEEAMLDAMYRALCEYEGQLAMCAVGPLTNVAKLINKYPEAKAKLHTLSIMGGGIHVYNVNPNEAEFNIYDDPHAANIVLEDPELKPKVVVCPLDVTHKVLCDDSVQKKILNEPNTTAFRTMIYDLITFFASTYKEAQGFDRGPPIHDPVAVYVLMQVYHLRDCGVNSQQLEIHVDEHGEHEGKMISAACDDTVSRGGPRGVSVVFDIDVRQFWTDLLETITIADGCISEQAN
ncbi:rihA [Cyberlindnera jadinii]|uniref:RihA protein n=1 Tax=Cyberlindnera jadinii (strain ATCC 18201 / CBS 1600 / BCRC 20928 / JCM 3617 / NBRC 0987 / NRRL Y-1542) TaxID=983966 RepID=A0A0H5BXV5_CYBJN|nr:rihA [Cyberlindnera jadinii]